ncbi:MAG: hypothetical protein HWN65_05665 [Candidatus Helarchaeota archaeon]|nr:hypothetical protein [Candidatus Helarchaeota archaeon]
MAFSIIGLILSCISVTILLIAFLIYHRNISNGLSIIGLILSCISVVSLSIAFLIHLSIISTPYGWEPAFAWIGIVMAIIFAVAGIICSRLAVKKARSKVGTVGFVVSLVGLSGALALYIILIFT